MRNTGWQMLLTAAIFALTPMAYVGAEEGIAAAEEATWQESYLIYPYEAGRLYPVKTQLGRITDIELRAGERIQNVLAGETKRWGIETAMVGRVPHVYVKPKAADISTNFIINTNQRSYRLMLSSTDSYTPIIRWKYKKEIQKSGKMLRRDNSRVTAVDEEIFMKWHEGRLVPKVLNDAYRLQGSKRANEALYPKRVFDDGTRTYIEMPKSNRYDLPVLYNVDDAEKKGKLTLVNYRMRHGYFIADRIFQHARLYFSHRVYVDIYPAPERLGGEEA